MHIVSCCCKKPFSSLKSYINHRTRCSKCNDIINNIISNYSDDIINKYQLGFSIIFLEKQYSLTRKTIQTILLKNKIILRDINGSTNKSINKRKNTCLEKYGVENPFQSEKIKEKSKETKLKLYSNKNFNNRKKSKETCLEKYGCEVSSQNSKVRLKYEETCLKRYGVKTYPFDEIFVYFPNDMLYNVSILNKEINK